MVVQMVESRAAYLDGLMVERWGTWRAAMKVRMSAGTKAAWTAGSKVGPTELQKVECWECWKAALSALSLVVR